MISLHSQDRFGPMALRSGQQERIGKITEADDGVHFAIGTTPLKVVAVGDSEDSHLTPTA